MSKVECVVSFPTNFAPFVQYLYGAIDNIEAKVTQNGSDKITVYDDDVVLADGLIVFIAIKAPPNIDINMDIMIDGTKFNKKAIPPTFKPNYYEFYHTV